MDPMENSEVLPNYWRVSVCISNERHWGQQLLRLDVVSDRPALALVSYRMMGAEEESTSEAHQNYLRVKGHKRKW